MAPPYWAGQHRTHTANRELDCYPQFLCLCVFWLGKFVFSPKMISIPFTAVTETDALRNRTRLRDRREQSVS